MAGNSVAVRHPKDPTRPWVIPRSRYDPAKHDLWEEPLKGEPKLVVEGEAVRNLDELPGIGQVTERRINERLSEEGDG